MQTPTESNLPAASPSSEKQNVLIGLGVLVFIVAITYYETLSRLVVIWFNQQDYVYGFFVIPFSAFLLWDRRDMLKDVKFQMSWWCIPCFVLGALMRFYANYTFNQYTEYLSLIFILVGVVLFLASWPALRWAWSAIAFLVFMFPLPMFLSGAFSRVLQKVATQIGVYMLQTLGIPAVSEGTVIVLTSSKLGVVEACSGMRMLMLFFAACVGAAFLLRQRDILTRIIIVFSAIPIAIISNVSRIVLTAILYEFVSQELGNKIFHDLAGWFMMPLAICLLWLETSLLSRLFQAPERESTVIMGSNPIHGVRRGVTTKSKKTPLGKDTEG